MQGYLWAPVWGLASSLCSSCTRSSKTHRSLTEPRLLEHAASASYYPPATFFVAASSAAATFPVTLSATVPAEAEEEEKDPDTDNEAGLQEDWALCNLCF